MAFFRNLERVVPSSLFMRPNSLYLQSRFRPVFLAEKEPSIDHLHTVRPLLQTIRILESHASNPAYEKLVKRELAFLNTYAAKYAEAITKFVSQGGLLTGEGIANVYFAAEALKIPAEWLEKNVHSDIPFKYRNMSRQNLVDLVSGLEKYHKGSPYLTQVKTELAGRPEEVPTYVVHQANESNRYDFAESNPSNHTLVSVINNGSSAWHYYLSEAWRRFTSRGKYVLHSE